MSTFLVETIGEQQMQELFGCLEEVKGFRKLSPMEAQVCVLCLWHGLGWFVDGLANAPRGSAWELLEQRVWSLTKTLGLYDLETNLVIAPGNWPGLVQARSAMG